MFLNLKALISFSFLKHHTLLKGGDYSTSVTAHDWLAPGKGQREKAWAEESCSYGGQEAEETGDELFQVTPQCPTSTQAHLLTVYLAVCPQIQSPFKSPSYKCMRLWGKNVELDHKKPFSEIRQNGFVMNTTLFCMYLLSFSLLHISILCWDGTLCCLLIAETSDGKPFAALSNYSWLQHVCHRFTTPGLDLPAPGACSDTA